MPLDHVSFGSNDLPAARNFYAAVLSSLGLVLLDEKLGGYADFGEPSKDSCANIEFSIETPVDGKPATVGNGVHVCFRAMTRQAVQNFHAAALAAGGRCEGPPGIRENYHSNYYGAFVRDLDGNKIEAVCHVDAEDS